MNIRERDRINLSKRRIKHKKLNLCLCGRKRYKDKLSCYNCYILHKKQAKIYRENNRDKIALLGKKYRIKIRKIVLDHYGKKCVCCSETEEKFLCIDHIRGYGNKHREKLRRSGYEFYSWLIQKKFPNGFQTLCHNCNMAKAFYGKCPHTEKR